MHNENFARDFIHNKAPKLFSVNPYTIIELGANHGLYTKVFATYPNAMVYAFEPHPLNIYKLEEAVAGFDDVMIVERAASNERGLIKFFECAANPGGHTMMEAIADKKLNLGHDPEKYVPVIAVKLDDYFGYDETTPVAEKDYDTEFRFMKVDVEGAEVLALAGAYHILRCSRMVVLLETHIKINAKTLYDMFKELGYTVYNDKFEEVDHIEEDAHYVVTNIGKAWE